MGGFLMASEMSVSIIRLIADPDAYDGKKIRVEGYLHIRFENNALYLSKEDGDHLMGKNGLWISVDSSVELQAIKKGGGFEVPAEGIKYFDAKYVLLEGIFDKSKLGHLGAYSGTIANVTRIMEQTRWYDGRKELTK